MTVQSNLKAIEGPDVSVVLDAELLESLGEQPRQEIASIIARARQDVRRAIKRAEQPEGFERIEIKQSKGPTLEFWGRELCSDAFETRGRDPLRISMEIYETKGGALVAVSASTPISGDGFESVRATVVEPREDRQAMHFEVLSALDWHVRARSMVTKKLRWSLRRDVD